MAVLPDNHILERQKDESGEDEPGVYWVYWTTGGELDPVWRANFLDHQSYLAFILKNGIIVEDQGWYEIH